MEVRQRTRSFRFEVEWFSKRKLKRADGFIYNSRLRFLTLIPFEAYERDPSFLPIPLGSHSTGRIIPVVGSSVPKLVQNIFDFGLRLMGVLPVVTHLTYAFRRQVPSRYSLFRTGASNILITRSGGSREEKIPSGRPNTQVDALRLQIYSSGPDNSKRSFQLSGQSSGLRQQA